MTEQEKSAITQALSELVWDIWPLAVLAPKYGGQMVHRLPNEPSRCIGGIFVYRGHVSLEFSRGAELIDTTFLLQGSGKLRRHIKLTCLADLEERQCRHFLLQSAALDG